MPFLCFGRIWSFPGVVYGDRDANPAATVSTPTLVFLKTVILIAAKNPKAQPVILSAAKNLVRLGEPGHRVEILRFAQDDGFAQDECFSLKMRMSCPSDINVILA
ncbi:MAG: hypothetical protein N3B12_07630 [Armatimonadetes bacterium]|nr:hypothetical protein [Armatimonadota bacterium]